MPSTTACEASGPIALVLDFSHYAAEKERTLLSGALRTLTSSSTETITSDGSDGDGNGDHIRLAEEVNAALVAFGAVFHLSQSSVPPSPCAPDGCVPVAVIGLFPSADEGTSSLETVWLYNSMDADHFILDEDVREGCDIVGEKRPRRAHRLWTSGRHYEDDVLPIIIGTIKTRMHMLDSCSPQTRAYNVDQTSTRTTVCGSSSVSLINVGKERTLHGALLKALCFIHQQTKKCSHSHTVGRGNNQRRQSTSSLSAGAEGTPITRPAVLLAMFSSSATIDQARGNGLYGESKEDLNAAFPSFSELSSSVLAMQLLATKTQLYVGTSIPHHHHTVHGRGAAAAGGEKAKDAACAPCVPALFALAASSGGAGGALCSSGVAENNKSVPTVLDHILGAVDEATTQLLTKAASGPNSQQRGSLLKFLLHPRAAFGGGSGYYGGEGSAANSATAAVIAQYPVHFRYCNSSEVVVAEVVGTKKGNVPVASSIGVAAKRDECGVSYVDSESLCLIGDIRELQ